MSLDFIEDAADALDKQDYPYAIVHGNGENTTARTYSCEEDSKEALIAVLRKFADDIEEGII